MQRSRVAHVRRRPPKRRRNHVDLRVVRVRVRVARPLARRSRVPLAAFVVVRTAVRVAAGVAVAADPVELVVVPPVAVRPAAAETAPTRE